MNRINISKYFITALIALSLLIMGNNNTGSLFSQSDIEEENDYLLGYELEEETELKLDGDSPLSLTPEDVVFVKRKDKYFDIYIRKKPQIESVLITSIPSDNDYITKEIYGLKSTNYNPVNGDEQRLFDGEFLEFDENTEPKYFLVDSSVEPALPFFDNAFHILVPPFLEYGYEDIGQYGSIHLKEGMSINIRTYSAKYADNRTTFVDNIFTIKFDDSPPTVKLLGYEEINKDYIKVYLEYEDDKNFDSFFIREAYPRNERFKPLNIINNEVPEDMVGQLQGIMNDPEGGVNIRVHVDIQRPSPEEEKRTVVVTAIDKSGNSALSPVRFTIKANEEIEETSDPDETPVAEDSGKYDERTAESFLDIAESTGGKNLVSKAPDDLPDQIIRAINHFTEGYDGDDLDLIFVIDSTGSMSDDIDYVKQELKSILRTITDQFQRANIGIVLYKDKGDDFITKGFPFTEDLNRIKLQIDSIRPRGGGDKPEAIIDALYYAIEEYNWTAGKRVVMLMGDAPPHDFSVHTEPKLGMNDIYKAATRHDIKIQIYTITVPTY